MPTNTPTATTVPTQTATPTPAATPTPSSFNLISNGDFSNGTTDWGYAQPPAIATADVQNGEFRMTITNDGVKNDDVDCGNYNQFTLTSGEIYRLSVDIRSSINRSVKLVVRDKVSDAWYFNQLINIDSTMRTYSFDFTMGVTSNSVEFAIFTGEFDTSMDAHYVYLDNVILMDRSNLTAGSNLIINSGFETGALYPPWITNNGGTIVNTNARTGTYSSYVSNWAGIYQSIAVKPNITYTYSGYIKICSGGKATIYVKNYDAPNSGRQLEANMLMVMISHWFKIRI